MSHIIDRLATLRISDVMTLNVQTVGRNQSMGEVAVHWVQHELSSAPVVDELGHCVGVLSAADFVKRESGLQKCADDVLLPPGGETEFRCVPITEDFVSDHMTGAVQTIDAGASLLKAARIMCAEHIHHLVVIDESKRPVGVVSTMDVVAATVNIVDEMDRQSVRPEV